MKGESQPLHTPLAQLVEHLTLNQWVVGSSPTGRTEQVDDPAKIIDYNPRHDVGSALFVT